MQSATATATETDTEFLVLYDKYSSVLYGFLIKLTSSVEEAESLLIETFEKLYRHPATHLHKHCILPHLLRLSVGIAYSHNFDKAYFNERINRLPVLHKLLLGNLANGNFDEEQSPLYPDHGKRIAIELRQLASVSNLPDNNN